MQRLQVQCHQVKSEADIQESTKHQAPYVGVNAFNYIRLAHHCITGGPWAPQADFSAQLHQLQVGRAGWGLMQKQQQLRAHHQLLMTHQHVHLV